jgi:hypothetical protein
MSDSLNATVIVIVLVLTISANAELVPLDAAAEPPDAADEPPDAADEPPEPPRLPELELPVPLVVELEPELLVPVLPADTESPGERLASDTIVPLVGADRDVSESAVSAFCTANWALYTDACAEATLPAADVGLVEPPAEEPPEPAAPDGAADVGALAGAGVVAAGVVGVGAFLAGVVVVVGAGVVVVVFGGVVVVGVVGVVVVREVVVVVVGWAATFVVSETKAALGELTPKLAAVAPGTEAVVDVADELDEELLCAAVS